MHILRHILIMLVVLTSFLSSAFSVLSGETFTPKTITASEELTMTGISYTPKTISASGELIMTGVSYAPTTITPSGELSMTGMRKKRR
jgi:hypothetical protein